MDRRKRRSERKDTAVQYYLESLRTQEGVESVVLSDAEGLLMGGAGGLDHDELGALGAASPENVLPYREQTLHVTRLILAGTEVVLTATGKRVAGRACAEHLARILC